MKEIKLTKGRFAIVDDEDYEILNKYKWYVDDRRKVYYAQRISINEFYKKTTIRMHREITNAPKHLQVDHINGNGLDNRKSNLRLCTNQQNYSNRIFSRKGNKIGIKGISWIEKENKYMARIMFLGRRIYIGYFSILNDAIKAHRIAEKKYFGEFARNV